MFVGRRGNHESIISVSVKHSVRGTTSEGVVPHIIPDFAWTRDPSRGLNPQPDTPACFFGMTVRAVGHVNNFTTYRPITFHTVDFEGFVASNFEGCLTNFAPRKALKLMA